jgi:hypothetical protein
VFVKPAGGWATTSAFEAKLTAADGVMGDEFGRSVAVRRDAVSCDTTVVVGARLADIPPPPAVGVNKNQGAAYVFVKPAGGGWTQRAKLIAADGAQNDWLGVSAAISGDTVVVGAPFANVDGHNDQGAAYVFVKPGSGWAGTLTESAKLTAADGRAGDEFGRSVAISGDTVVVGAPPFADLSGGKGQGAAYVFMKPGSGWATTNTVNAKLTAPDGGAGDEFGLFVANRGDTVVVGAPGVNKAQGAAYVFMKPGSGWATTNTVNARLTAPASDGGAGDEFGRSVAISRDAVVVGAWLADIGGNKDQGTVYVFGSN